MPTKVSSKKKKGQPDLYWYQSKSGQARWTHLEDDVWVFACCEEMCQRISEGDYTIMKQNYCHSCGKTIYYETRNN